MNKRAYTYTDGAVGAPVQTVPYTYGDSNWKDKLTAYNNSFIAYDAIGNPLGDGTWTYTWAKGRQLQSMSKAGETVSFAYNADGLRVRKETTTTGVTDYTLHGKNVVHMTNGSNNLHFFYDARNKPAVVIFNGTAYAYLYNLQGDVIGLVDSNGTKMVSYTYDVWGKMLSKTGTLASTLGTIQPFRYRAHVFDEETELYYLRDRYYLPARNRFLNCDIMLISDSFALSSSAYAYCANNSVNRSDPSGKLYVALELYTIALSVANNSYHDFSGTLLAEKMTERIRASKLIKNRVADYIKAMPNGEKTYSKTEPVIWRFEDSIKSLYMADLDLSLAVGNASSLTITVEKVDKGFFESLFFWGDKYKVTYSVQDLYDFDKWEGTNRNAALIWINDNLGYYPQEAGILHTYWYTITDEYYVYVY